MIFGWGKSSSTIAIPNNTTQTILTTFAYFHLIFLLRVTFAREWYLVTGTLSENKDGSVNINQKKLTQSEVNELVGKSPVNPLWWLFNQSLIWFIIGIIALSGLSNFTRIGNPAVSPTKTTTEIIQSKYWTPEEEKRVIETATDDEFEQFLTKFKKETLLKKAVGARIKFKTSQSSKVLSVTSINSSN
jgi:hypothetical protein